MFFKLAIGINLVFTCHPATRAESHNLQKTNKISVVQNGKAMLDIILPDKPLPVVQLAAKELQYHINKATGITLPIKKESNSGSTPSIYLGSCKKTLDAGLNTKGLKANECRIDSQNGNLFIIGDDNAKDPLRMPKYNSYARVGTLFGVYYLLESEMKIKWLWPGELGEIIPRCSSLAFKKQNFIYSPKLAQKRWSSPAFVNCNKGWKSPKIAKKYYHDEFLWLRRHRFAQAKPMVGCHAFSRWWKRFWKNHPEWFALMPDGSRGIDPRQKRSQKSSHAITMCISNESLRKQLIKSWNGKGNLNVGENDANGRCTCPDCMAMDMRKEDYKSRLKSVAEAFNKNLEGSRWKGWPLSLGSLSDRYSRFCLKVQQDARKINPNVIVVGSAYANWVQPPVNTKLNDKIYIEMVPPFYFPFTDKRINDFRKVWKGWEATGCKLILRPNYTLSGHNMPIFYARKLGKDLAFFTKNGMIGALFDSLTGQWASQGPNLYMLARMLENPEISSNEVLEEYYSAFYPANKEVKEYFRYLEKVSNTLDEDLLERVKEGKLDYVNSYSCFYRAANVLFTPEVFSKAKKLLDKAAKASNGDKIAEARINFLKAGLRNAELTAAVEQARQKGEKDGNMSQFYTALQKLDDFRAQNESTGIGNMYFLWRNETGASKSAKWNRKYIINPIKNKAKQTSSLTVLSPNNLIKNGSFEEGLRDWGFIAADRKKYEVETDNSTACCGKNSLKIKIKADGKGRFRQKIPVEPGKSYTLKARIKTSRDFSGNIPFYAEKAKLIQLGTNGAWKEIILKNIKSKRNIVYLSIWMSKQSGTVWLDGIELYPN